MKYTEILFTAYSVVGIKTRLQAGRSRVRIPAGSRDFSLLQDVQSSSGYDLASYPMGNRDSFLEVNRPGRETDRVQLLPRLRMTGGTPTFAPVCMCTRGGQFTVSGNATFFLISYRIQQAIAHTS